MAKRRRLDPVPLVPAAAAPETKAMFPPSPEGVWRAPPRAPVSQVAGDAATAAALDELAQTLREARAEGRLIQALPLDSVDEGYLIRDRMAVETEEMEALLASLRARGQQTAIEVADLGDGRYGLISGWRRLTALRRLAEAGEGPDRVLAILRAPAEAAEAYLAMVEENEIRVGLGHYERARIVARAVDQGVYRADRVALPALFGAVSRSKRSKIGAFLRIVRALDDALRFPAALTERTGLALAQALEADPGTEGRLRAALAARPPADAAAEAALIARVLAGNADNAARAPALAEGEVSDRGPDRPLAPAPAAALSLQEDGHGRLILSGPQVSNPGFRTRLRAFLRTEGCSENSL